MKIASTSVVIVVSLLSTAFAADSTPEQLADMSVEELLSSPVIVSSVSRRPGSVQQAAAAVTVISQEEIRRSGATNIPDILRMVPGMDVARVDSHQWAVSARGFNDLFANKLLVMIDGRSVYASLFSGTFWDVQDLVIEDVDRIEVIRGPGASLWGANAVNGVINILTKKAANTQGWLITQSGGTQDRYSGAIRYGGKLGDDLHYRVYAKYATHDDSDVFGSGFPEALIRLNLGGRSGTVRPPPPPRTPHDSWTLGHIGFRADWEPPGADRLTFQGELYRGHEQQLYQRLTPGSFNTFFERATDTVSGGHVLAKWTHTFSNSSDLILQTYYDRTVRELAVLGEARDTFDVDLQHRFALGGRQTIVWGAGYRRISDRLRNTIDVALLPTARTTNLFSAFVQDEIALVKERLVLTLGSKFEHNDFTGIEIQPTVRLLFTPNQRNTIWAAASRAVRTPSRAEDDFRLTYPGVPADVLFAGAPAIVISVQGNRQFEAEKLTAYEMGYRAHLTDRLGLDLAVYYNEYRALRGVALTNSALDFTTSPVEIGITFDNQPSAETIGGELGATLRVTDRWRLRAHYSLLRMTVHSASTVKLGSFGADALEGSSPQQQVSIRSSIDLPHGLEFDAALRWVDELSALNVPSYLGLDLRLGWRVSKNVEISLVGQNLLDGGHPEFRPSFFSSQATEVQRSVYAKVTLRF